MKIKPFKITVEDTDDNKSEDIIKPFKVEVNESLDTGNENLDLDLDLDLENISTISFLQSFITFFSSINGIFFTIIIFIFIIIISDTIKLVSNILAEGTLSEYVYLFGILILLSVLILNIISNIKQIKFLKHVQLMKKKFILQKNSSSKEIIPLANFLLNQYKINASEELQLSISHIEEEINNSQIYNEIYQDLESVLLPHIDNKAKEIVYKASIQAAITTAISQNAILDMILIIWRSILLTKEISLLYGFKPGGYTTIVLLKQATINIAFAGVSEMALDMSNEITSSTILSKISKSAGQGMANGILLARLGYGLIEACRPIEFKEKRSSFVNVITKAIIESLNINIKKD